MSKKHGYGGIERKRGCWSGGRTKTTKNGGYHRQGEVSNLAGIKRRLQKYTVAAALTKRSFIGVILHLL